ncbi:hypothetical protein [Gordonia rhizosphera]|uniref:Lipoprotein n=1 Tax=Gordonia rhizosphera NBRC 16068 TaxID=1108045 RepID=K6VBA4_9ACTN|nr:hypothetical protein [Gordonia rhizosphera]GAB93498.1 hypothetical protein GORHZ_225_00210 [Gordonia rhizosphera NBRC 16068]
MTRRFAQLLATAATFATAVAGCSATSSEVATSSTSATSAATSTAAEPTIPVMLAPFGPGYPNEDSGCRRLGESPQTSQWLDDSAILVGCTTDAAARALHGTIVAVVGGITIVSIPMGDANADMRPEASSTTPQHRPPPP